MSNYSTKNDFEDILQRMLDRIPDTLDKRQGSIIYDALAPAAAELAQCYITLDVYQDQTYLENAVGENLDNRVADYGIVRNQATFSRRIGEFRDTEDNLMTIELGTRFSIPNINGGYNYKVIEYIEIGRYVLECETSGSVGNEYFGELLPLTSINNLGSAFMNEIYIAGEDAESDESLRARTIAKLTETPFGGNISEYRQYVENLEGIGACLVIPVWNGGGTVKIVPITSSYNIPTDAKIQEIQTLLDPVQNQGIGLGIAPIGHVVTVAAPTRLDINIEADIQLEDTYTLEGIKEAIDSSINEYMTEVQLDWATVDQLTIYNSRLIAAILTVKGVTNVENLTINGETGNILINPTDENNPFPILNEVILNED